MRGIFIMLISLTLSACTTLLVKEGMTPLTFEKDKKDCEQRAIAAAGGVSQMERGEWATARAQILKCMLAKEYKEVPSADEHKLWPSYVMIRDLGNRLP